MVDFVSLFTGMSERDIGFLLKSIVQDSINSQLTNAEISEVDEKTPVLITNSKDVELMNDISIQSAINKEPSTVYLMPEEPDGTNLKLWLKFQNVGELRDYSYQKNKSYSTGGNTMPGLFSKYNSNSMMKYELYSYFNGISHYAYTVDGPTVRILPNITANKVTSFFMRLVPVSLAKLLYAENNALFTKVDDDQLRYGYSVTVDSVGNLHFYIRNDYRQYHLAVIDAYNYILTDPLYDDNSNFRFENFNKKNFLTGFEFLCGLVAAELPFHDWLFKYNPVTHNMSVINTIEGNTSAVVADTSLVTPAPILSLPLQEGKYTHSGTVQTTVYDNSGNGYTGNIVNYTLGGSWEDDNTLLSNGIYTAGVDNCLQIQFGSITALNTLTEFTIAFWYNPLDDLFNTTEFYEMIWRKGNDAANTIWMQRPPQAQGNEIAFRLRTSAGVYHRVDFPNPFPTPYKWYFVVCKWKSGEKLKISIDNSTAVESGTNITDTLTNSTNHFELFNNGRAPKCKIALFRVYNTQITQLEQDDLYYEGYHNPLFPKSENIQPVVEETPDPVLVPFTNVYTLDKMTTPVLADYRRINSLAGDTPLIPRYNVDDGVDETDPELNPYTIADGATTTADPETRVGSAPATIDSSNNSNGTIGDGQNDMYGLKITATDGVGIGDTMIGKVLTKAIVWMRKTSAEITGTLYFRIWNATDTGLTTPVATLGSVAANTLTQGSSGSEWYPITFQNTANTVALADGFRIGVEYQGYGSGDVVNVQRLTPRAENTTIQTTYDGGWNTNTSFTMKCDLYTGAGTVAAEPNIIMKTGSYNRVVEGFGVSDPLMTKIIGKVTLRLKKVGSPTGTATIALVNNASPPVVKAAIGTLDVSTLTTTTADYTFTNYVHNVPVASGDRLGIIWTPSASGEVHVMTNKGNLTSNTWQGSTSYVLKYISSWSTETTLDLAGKIYTGGNDFDAELRFSTTRTRIGEKAVNSSSDFHNRKINKVLFRAKKVGTPAGIINCYVRDPSDNIKVTFSSVDISTVGTSLQDIIFENYSHNYLINSATGSGDKVIVEYSGSTVTDYLQLNTDRDTGTLNSITQTYDSGNYVDNAQRHLAGHLYEGGEPDLVSRTRVAQSIHHQNSILKGKKITSVYAHLIKTGTASGTVYCNIRTSSDALIKTLGTFSVSSLSSTVSAPSFIEFTDVTNNYPMTVDDRICIEFTGGDSSNQVGVLVRNVTPNYDGMNSYIRKFDEFTWDDAESTYDLCAAMYEGGFYFTPEPNSIPDPTPTNIKDLLYCAGNNAKSGFFETFLMEFRIYAKDITLTNADNLYNNRYSISPIGNGEILMPFSLKMSSLTEP
jgi:hypothetical protein